MSFKHLHGGPVRPSSHTRKLLQGGPCRSLQACIQNITERWLCLGQQQTAELWRRMTLPLEYVEVPFAQDGGGDPKLHSVFWMESQWERPERLTVHVTGLTGGPQPPRCTAACGFSGKVRAPSPQRRRYGPRTVAPAAEVLHGPMTCNPQGQLRFLHLPAGPIFTSLRFIHGSGCVGVCAGYTRPGLFLQRVGANHANTEITQAVSLSHRRT